MKGLMVFLGLLVLTACEKDGSQQQEQAKTMVSDEVVQEVSKKKIYFGHQSVGYNILSGIKDVLSEDQLKQISIIDSQDTDAYTSSMIGHSRIGYNSDPLSKIIGFSNYMDNLSTWHPDMAMLKLCYVDFSRKTDPDRLFLEYKNRLDRLKHKYPDTIFVHITAPLTTIQTGIKAEIKKILGKQPAGIEENIIRNRYNDLMRETYGSKEPIFDLAKIESTLPDGSRSTFEVDGKTYYSLADIYTSDGGHLNSLGRRIVAEKLLEFLAETGSNSQN